MKYLAKSMDNRLGCGISNDNSVRIFKCYEKQGVVSRTWSVWPSKPQVVQSVKVQDLG